MLIGEYTHSIDEKKRVSLPTKFRKEIGAKVVVTHGLDNCLFLFPMKAWEKISEKLSESGMGTADSRGFNRFILAGASEVEVDSAGRILIPEYLKKFAGLEDSVIVTGVHDRVEIWNEKAWTEYKKRIEKQADALAEKLGQVGIF